MAEVGLGLRQRTHSRLTTSLSASFRVGGACRTGAYVVLGTALVALCARITIPLGFTPVPLTMQPFAVMLLGLLLEPAAGFSCLAFYLLEGATGFPVFTPHGLGGVLQILGPSGGSHGLPLGCGTRRRSFPSWAGPLRRRCSGSCCRCPRHFAGWRGLACSADPRQAGDALLSIDCALPPGRRNQGGGGCWVRQYHHGVLSWQQRRSTGLRST